MVGKLIFGRFSPQNKIRFVLRNSRWSTILDSEFFSVLWLVVDETSPPPRKAGAILQRVKKSSAIVERSRKFFLYIEKFLRKFLVSLPRFISVRTATRSASEVPVCGVMICVDLNLTILQKSGNSSKFHQQKVE